MSTEIERIEEEMPPRNQPNPMEVLQGIAVMQCITLGFLVGSQFMMKRNINLVLRAPRVKEVVVVYKEVKEEIG
jgi:hypothetical protein